MDEQSAVPMISPPTCISFCVSSLYRKNNPCLGDILVRFSPTLKLYTDYLSNFDREETQCYQGSQHMDEQSAVPMISPPTSISFCVSSLYKNDNPCLGDILVRLSPFLKLYTYYLSNFDNAIKDLNTWMNKVLSF